MAKGLIDTLINNGYKVATYDKRNYSESGKSNVNLDDILTNKDLASKIYNLFLND
ncbi:MAG TPA: hypothetical protein VIL99_01405 [Ignavibacteria bacterium]|jgi:hypothetical protein